MADTHDMFVLGCMHTLNALKYAAETEDVNTIDWNYLLEEQRRNLSDPRLEKCLEKDDTVEALK